MDICYGCLHPLEQTLEALPSVSLEDARIARFSVVLLGAFSYEMRLKKREGALLTVGSASANNIVIPSAAVAQHQLDIFYSQERIWIEEKGLSCETDIDGIPLLGTRSIKPGAQLQVGDAVITLVSD
jgi:hypothetical protein